MSLTSVLSVTRTFADETTVDPVTGDSTESFQDMHSTSVSCQGDVFVR